MDESIVRHLEQPQVGALKLSEAVRECGYGDSMTYRTCVLGRAYTRLTGRSLSDDGFSRRESEGFRGYANLAADAFGVPRHAAYEAERMCARSEPPAAIADWLESQGL